MLNAIKSFFALDFVPHIPLLPKLDALPDMTRAGVTMDYLICGISGENKEVPRVGDVVVKLTSCSMGMTISRDTRYRVTERLCHYSPKPNEPNAVRGVTLDGKSEILHVFYMRRHTRLARTWILMD